MVRKNRFGMTIALALMTLGLACSSTSDPLPQGNASTNNDNSMNGAAQLTEVRSLGVTKGVNSASSILYGGQNSGIWVSGTGRITVTPDMGLLDLGIEARAETVARASEQAAVAMKDVRNVLTNSGIEEEDIRTTFFNIQPEYVWNESKRKQEIASYRVTNTLNIKVRDPEEMGPLIDKIATAGGDLTRINSVQFTPSETEHLASKAREAAVKQALAKARQFAQLTNVTLGKLAYITESDANVPIVQDFGIQERMALASAAPQTPISQGQTDITVTIQAVFGIE